MSEETPYRKLSYEELEQIAPKCCVCGEPISEDRQKRRKTTCSDNHSKVHQQYRRHLWSKTRCASCYRPSTPQERKEFRSWRQSEGFVMQTIVRGRPKKTRTRQLEDAIEAALTALDTLQLEDGQTDTLDSLRAMLTEVIRQNHAK
jgi:predicted nucleic acid-binding Zn ribbon protein